MSQPDLADQEDETINQDIVELQKAHLQQVIFIFVFVLYIFNFPKVCLSHKD